ncbi:hypothetical protein [Paraburkholderia sp. RAU2J]|nr:hypothetical protein [Paraburkholderia sp. RAU2J]
MAFLDMLLAGAQPDGTRGRPKANWDINRARGRRATDAARP